MVGRRRAAAGPCGRSRLLRDGLVGAAGDRRRAAIPTRSCAARGRMATPVPGGPRDRRASTRSAPPLAASGRWTGTAAMWRSRSSPWIRPHPAGTGRRSSRSTSPRAPHGRSTSRRGSSRAWRCPPTPVAPSSSRGTRAIPDLLSGSAKIVDLATGEVDRPVARSRDRGARRVVRRRVALVRELRTASARRTGGSGSTVVARRPGREPRSSADVTSPRARSPTAARSC